ncbi:hypothetical protein KKD52_07390, partial [Myxococcota bacterium]|nr:hypothetical protein [Myxococcota bacterium]MBU1510170.1 hypothetical protein [Myxococcota bacterium]
MRKMLMLTILLGFVAAGCRGEEDGSMPRRTVQSDLPITKVVLYQNGVGYIERAGKIKGSTLN